jgi:hypothetical protein
MRRKREIFIELPMDMVCSHSVLRRWWSAQVEKIEYRECSWRLEFTSVVAVWGASRLPTVGNHISRLLEEHHLVSEQLDSMDTFRILQ